MSHVWDLWFPNAAATGLPFCRARVEPNAVGDTLLVHAAPPVLDVVVRDEKGNVVAEGSGLERHAPGPMVTLSLRDGHVSLVDRWPDAGDVGRLVLLPGGEAGVLRSWWHAEDHSEWRWHVEFFNHV